MEPNTFVPKIPNKVDGMSRGLMKASQFLLVLVVSLSPLFFVPNISGGLGFAKVYLLLFILLIALVLSSLAILRSGLITFRLSPLLLSWWGIVITAFLSALLSPSISTSYLEII